MTSFKQLDQNVPKIIIDTEDDSFNTFCKLLMKSGLLEEDRNVHQWRCKKAPPKITIGNRFKKIDTELSLYEGDYNVTWNENDFVLSVERGDVKLVSECRMIEYLKRISVVG